MELFSKKIEHAHLENISGVMRMSSDLQLVYNLHDYQKFLPIVKYKQYQISSGARPSLLNIYEKPQPLYYNNIEYM